MRAHELSVGVVALSVFLRELLRHKHALIGFVIISLFGFAAISAEYICPYGPFKLGTTVLERPNLTHLFGTDDLGRDIFGQVSYGSKVSLTVGFLSAIIAVFLGILCGSVAGYFGGVIDEILMRITELFQVIPRLFLAIVFVALFGPHLQNVITIISVLTWPTTARLVRGEFLRIKETEFVEAARALGANNKSIIFSEILPNAVVPAIINTSLEVADAIRIEAGLSFLGLSDPYVMSWGYMLQNAQRFMRVAWWLPIFPGLSILLLVLGFNLIGDGLNDTLNPRLRRR